MRILHKGSSKFANPWMKAERRLKPIAQREPQHCQHQKRRPQRGPTGETRAGHAGHQIKALRLTRDHIRADLTGLGPLDVAGA